MGMVCNNEVDTIKNQICYEVDARLCDASVVVVDASTSTIVGSSWIISMFPSLGGDFLLMNSVSTGSLLLACRSARRRFKYNDMHIIFWVGSLSLASSSRIGTPPISNKTRPVGTLLSTLGYKRCSSGKFGRPT